MSLKWLACCVLATTRVEVSFLQNMHVVLGFICEQWRQQRIIVKYE